MPRKTRQQKLAAELRSLKSQLRTSEMTEVSSVPQSETRKTLAANRLSQLLNTTTLAATSRNNYDYGYVVKDLRKVAVLATIALLIEVVLSLTLNLGFANLLKDLLGR